jgi:DNA-3-methyladenine glycosylase
MEAAPLPASFYARDTELVARELLGCFLVARTAGVLTGGRIVEVEAYVGPHDPADHGYGNRKTARNAALFGPPGTVYVYFIYGAHWCFNAVTEREGYPAAVLIRALEPIWGIEEMSRRRKTQAIRVLCAGPGRLCQALGIDGSLNGLPLDRDSLQILPGDGPVGRVKVSGRVGVSRAADWPLRFSLAGSPYLSCPVR